MRRLLTAAVVLLALAGACGGDGNDDASAGAPDGSGFEVVGEQTADEMVAAVAAVCEAAGQAPTDLPAAEQTFHTKSHDGLHSIARQLEEVDRAAAAKLLTAKEQVESDFAEPAAAATIHHDLLALADAAGAGVRLLAPRAAPPNCG